jgi:hypothetical protein
MSSLKSFLPKLAPVLGSTADTLYERQRAAVRLGLLRPVAGRGRGSGVELSADSVAVLLICLGAAAGLSEVDGRIVKYCNAAAFTDRPSGTCPLTGEKKLRSAISKILADPKLAERVDSITFHHDRPFASIFFDEEPVYFGNFNRYIESGLSLSAELKKKGISDIVKLLAEENE